MKQVVVGRALALRFALISAIIMLASVQLAGTAAPAAAQGTATIEITNIDAGSGQPAPFTRFQATSENGTVYGPLETDLNGYVAFSVTVDPQGTSFTVEEETPPACATAPDPQTTDPLQAGDSTSLSFSTQDNPGCGLGTIALYAMACPDGFAGPADDYGPWRDGCTGTNDGTGFTLTSAATGDSWNPVAGEYGIPGRAPVVGLPSGDYTFQQNGDTPSAVFCLVYDTSNYATSPEPSSVLPVPLIDGGATISLSGNRISCDVFTVPGGAAVQSAETDSANVSLEVHVSQCPADYVFSDSIYDDCHGNGVPYVQLQLLSTAGYVADEQTYVPTTPGPGIARFVDLVSGSYSLSATAETFYTYCSDANDTEVPSTFDQANGDLALDIGSGQAVTCDLYVRDLPGRGDSSIEVHTMLCPQGTDPNGDLYELCHNDGVADVYVQIRTGSNPAGSGFAGDGKTMTGEQPGPGVLVFDKLGGGSYSISAGISDAQAGSDNVTVVVNCSLADSDETVPVQLTEYSTAYIQLPDATAVVCDWYYIPVAEVQPAAGTSSIEVHAALCPNGTNPDSDLYDACHGNGIDGITFTASGPNGYSGQQTTTLPVVPGPGVATFADLTGGTYTVTQENADPDSTIVMYCSLSEADDVVPFTPVDADTISFDLPDDTGVVCDFYTIPPADQATTLQVTKYSCPAGMNADENTPLSTFQQACTTLTNGVDFTLAPLGQQGSVLTTGSGGEGTLLFEGLPSGNFSLTEDIPGDFNTPFAFCGLEGGQLDPYTWIRGGDPLAIDASAGTYTCLWYNIPADAGQPSSISVTKYLCPEGTTSGYQSRCGSSPLQGATFVLDGPGQYEVDVVTGADGNAWWGELASGKYTLTEIPPSGVNVAVYVVSCEANGQDFATTYNDSNGMRIELDLPAGTDVSCNWYNIPPSTPTVTPNQPQGSITVHKFICQGKSVNAYNWDTDCSAESAPIGFSLKSADGRPIAVGTTNASGILKYTNLANGTYSLDETSGDWCHAEADRVDSAGNVIVADGGNTDVYIYNCSLKNVGTLPSTGTGSQGAAGTAEFDGHKAWLLLLAALGTIGLALIMRHRLHRAALRLDSAGDETPPVPVQGKEPVI